MLFTNPLLHLSIWCMCLCPISVPVYTIKIGISQNYNTNTTTTTTTTATEIAVASNNLENNSTFNNLPEIASTTPSQTFPPRKIQKPTTTAAVPNPRNSSTPTAAPTAAPPAETQPLNATAVPTTTKTTTTVKTAQSLKNSRFYYCSCDLYADLCEINCCCDRDCSPEMLQVFNCLLLSEAPQLQARLEDFHYTHGLPTCQLNDGWLCVFRSNTKPPKIQPFSTTFDAEQYNKWPELLSSYETQLAPTQNTAQYYKFGQPLQLWQPESMKVSNLELPIAYESANCLLKQSLLHLQPLQSSCLMHDAAQLQSDMWTLLNMSSSHQLLAKPRDLEEQDVHGINIEVCQELLLLEKVICLEQGNDTQLDILVDNIELQLLHNFTHILKAKLLLREASEQDENAQLWLRYKLVYTSLNDAPMKPSSGPLGYVQGEPVLLATLQAQNSSAKDQPQQLLSYFSSNSSQQHHHHHWLTLCERSVEQRHAVSFGVDLFQQCQLRQLAPVLPDHGNHTDYCQQLQANIWRKLLPHSCTSLDDLGKVYVSQLGRPQPDKWLPLQLSHTEDQRLPAILGIYDEAQQSLTCRNMLLSVRYQFYVAELTLQEGHILHQSVLLHARLLLGQRHDLEFVAGEQQVELPLTASVMFFKTQDNRHNSANIPNVAITVLIFMALLRKTLIADNSLQLC